MAVFADHPRLNDRLAGAVAALLLQGLIGYVLFTQLNVNFPRLVSDELKLIDITPTPLPPPPIKKPVQRKEGQRHKGKPAPPNLKSQRTEIVAPPPIRIVPPVLPPVVTAPIAGIGTSATQGAARRAGSGTGAGGEGSGNGGGGNGEGDGDFTPPLQIAGRIKGSDYRGLTLDHDLKAEVMYTVQPTGQISDCRITQRSGDPAFDQRTCAMIMQRFRYKPSLNPEGRPVSAKIVEYHSWSVSEERHEDGD
jgi:protein TonB